MDGKRNTAALVARWLVPSPKSLALGLSLGLSAFLMALAISSPRGVWLGWLGWVGLVPLFIAIRQLAPWRAMACGGFWGLCLFQFLEGFTPGLAGSVGALVLLVAAPAVYAGAGAWFTRRFGFSPLFLGLGWIAVELALQPLGLRAGVLAGTLGRLPLIDWVSGLLGSGLVAFVIAASNATLLLAVDSLRLPIRPTRLGITAHVFERFFPHTSTVCSSVHVRAGQPRAPPD